MILTRWPDTNHNHFILTLINENPILDKNVKVITIGLSKVVPGVMTAVAGIIVLAWNGAWQWATGIFLIVWGILTFPGKKQAGKIFNCS